MPGTETEKHLTLKKLALAWARENGLSIGAREVSFPHRKFRVDVAACCVARKTPSRKRADTLSSVLKAAAVFECKQVRGDLLRDNTRRLPTLARLKTLEDRRTRLETLLQVHLPHLANGESLFPEFDSYRFRESPHVGYNRLVKHIAQAKRAVQDSTKFDRLFSYRLANLHYLVTEDGLVDPLELPEGWGLLTREEEKLVLRRAPNWQDIGVEEQLVFLQQIASRKD